MSFAGATPTPCDTCSYRDQYQSCKRLVGQLRTPFVYRHFSAILALVSFLTFVATSSPHHVHHVGDAAPPLQRLIHQHHEHHGHEHGHDHTVPIDQPAPQPSERRSASLPTCVVLLVLQSIPILEAEQVFVSPPVESQPLECPAPWCYLPNVYTNSTRIRAPPSLLV
jgi:hypothetical protein